MIIHVQPIHSNPAPYTSRDEEDNKRKLLATSDAANAAAQDALTELGDLSPISLTTEYAGKTPERPTFPDARNSSTAADYVKAVGSGVLTGAKGLVNVVLHPFDTVIRPVASFLHDGAILNAAVGGGGPNPWGGDEGAVYAMLIARDPTIYDQAKARTQARVQAVRDVGTAFTKGTGPQRTEMVAAIATGFLLPGGIVKGVKALRSAQPASLGPTVPTATASNVSGAVADSLAPTVPTPTASNVPGAVADSFNANDFVAIHGPQFVPESYTFIETTLKTSRGEALFTCSVTMDNRGTMYAYTDALVSADASWGMATPPAGLFWEAEKFIMDLGDKCGARRILVQAPITEADKISNVMVHKYHYLGELPYFHKGIFPKESMEGVMDTTAPMFSPAHHVGHFPVFELPRRIPSQDPLQGTVAKSWKDFNFLDTRTMQ